MERSMIGPEEKETTVHDTPEVITPKDNTPIFNDWNTPVKRQAPSKEQQERMQELIKFNNMSESEKLKQLLSPEEESMSTGQEGEISFDTSTQPESSAERKLDPIIESQLNSLGVADTDQSVIDNDPRFDLNKKIHDPGIHAADIRKSTQMSAEDLKEQSEDLPQDSGIKVGLTQEEPVTILESQGPIPETEVSQESQDEHTDINTEAHDDDSRHVTDTDDHPSDDSSNVLSDSPTDSELPVQESDQAEIHSTVTVDPTDTIDTASNPNIAYNDVPILESDSPADIKEEPEELKEALSEISVTTNPYSADDVSDRDFTAKETIKEESKEIETDAPEEDDDTLTKQAALTTISSVYDAAVFGLQDNADSIIFDPSDMDVKIDNEIARAHIVLSNMTQNERLHYVLQTNAQALEDTAKNLYGTSGEFYETTHDALTDLAENIVEPTSYINRVHNSNGQFGNQAAIARTETLKKAKADFKEKHPDKNFQLSRNVKIKGAGPNGSDLLIDHKFADKSKLFQQISENGTANIKGPSATKITSLLINGYRQVNFYHSGFHVNLTAPRMDQLSLYYNKVSENMMDYGRILGQYAYLPVGVETRAALMDLFCECVESSNLKGWEDRDTLMRGLSVLDQPVAIWALASLMYPKGVEVEYLCHNNLPDGSKCRHVEKTKVDINSMCYNDWSKLSADAIVYTVSKETRTLEDLATYRAKYMKADGTTFPINKSGEWKAQFAVPSSFEAEEKQRAYVAAMAKEFQLSNLQKADDYFRSKTYLAYLPFVKKVMYVEDGKTIEFDDPSALEPALNNLQLVEGIALPERLTAYMDEKTMTHICFSYMPCPKCGKIAPEAIDRLIPCDPEYTFFVWTAARLQS